MDFTHVSACVPLSSVLLRILLPGFGAVFIVQSLVVDCIPADEMPPLA
jgi:hypothetical protein